MTKAATLPKLTPRQHLLLNNLLDDCHYGNFKIVEVVNDEDKVIYTGIGNTSGLHSYLDEAKTERFTKRKPNLVKRLTKAIAAGRTIKVYYYLSTNRNYGRWNHARTINTTYHLY